MKGKDALIQVRVFIFFYKKETMTIRTEEELLALLINVATDHEQIRLVTLEGSRSQVNNTQDIFQDYDVSYFVNDMARFEVNDEWLQVFGPRLIMQKPDAPFNQGLAYLMLFEDGNRIDLFVLPLSEWTNYLAAETAIRVLLDKDQRLLAAPKLQTDLYHSYLPTVDTFSEACNEFWWVSTYVVKGLCRGDYLYATGHFEQIVRQELLRLLAWRAVHQEGRALDLGKAYKNLLHYLDEDTVARLQATYNLSTQQLIWHALLTSQALFFEVSQALASDLGYPFSISEAENVRGYTRSYYNYTGGNL